MAKNALFAKITKFRELSPNKIMYVYDDHSAAMPHTVTITSTLPAPRKGNPGTLKTSIVIHKSVVLDAGKPTERVAPIVSRLETSFPMGSLQADRDDTLTDISLIKGLAADQEVARLLETGILPQD
jgi:hypothetical protein